jgi:hypothetical protein
MVPAPFIVLLDANVLFPFSLRDTLLRAAAAGFYQVRWSPAILDEMERNLVSSGVMTQQKADRLRSIIEREFPEAAVTDYEHLIPVMRNHEKDRHVSAAALRAGAQVITTSNLIEAQSPEVFLCNLFDLNPSLFVELLSEQAADLKNPPMKFDELLERLARVVPDFAAVVREHLRGK